MLTEIIFVNFVLEEKKKILIVNIMCFFRSTRFSELDRRADDLMAEIENLRVQKSGVMDQIARLSVEAAEIQRRMELCLDCLEQVKTEVQEARAELQSESEKENLMKFD